MSLCRFFALKAPTKTQYFGRLEILRQGHLFLRKPCSNAKIRQERNKLLWHAYKLTRELKIHSEVKDKKLRENGGR